jgi:Icc-related predicted phosphoesterase
MKPFLYVTDLHGNKGKYERTFTYALEIGAGLVINGGDIAPHARRLEEQERFYREFLGPYFDRYQEAGIRYLTLTGNDDFGSLDDLLDRICERTPLATHLSQRMVDVDGFTFIGMNRVTDYPFKLKDRARMDAAGYVFGKQFGPGVLSTTDGFREIPDWPQYAATIPTIEQELDALPAAADPARAVYVLHGPPSGKGLDRIRGGGNAGSAATLAFLLRTQPLLSLHGHIHESPEESGVWMARVGRTVSIQPGQSAEELVAVVGRLDGMTFERKILPVG